VQKFSLVWSSVPPGRYELTARAKDDRGAISVSEPIVIKVLKPCALPVVTIEATDKVGSEQNPLILILPLRRPRPPKRLIIGNVRCMGARGLVQLTEDLGEPVLDVRFPVHEWNLSLAIPRRCKTAAH